jgi:hypothetical protein
MENPPSIIVTPIALAVSAQFTRLTFSNLYIRRTSPGSRELTVDGRPSDHLGTRNVSDCPYLMALAPTPALWLAYREP